MPGKTNICPFICRLVSLNISNAPLSSLGESCKPFETSSQMLDGQDSRKAGNLEFLKYYDYCRLFLLPKSNTLTSWICLASSLRRKCSIFCDNYVILFWHTKFFWAWISFFKQFHWTSFEVRWQPLASAASPCIKALSPLESTYFPSVSIKSFFYYVLFYFTQTYQLPISVNKKGF